MANWKKIVTAVDNKLFNGWETTEEVAAQLECRPDTVATVLRQAIRQGEVESRTFTVWNRHSKQMETVVGYRQKSKHPGGMDQPDEESCTANGAAFSQAVQPARGRPRLFGKLTPEVGQKVMSLTGTIGVMDKEGGRWRVVWPHCRPTYPTESAFRRGRLRPVD